MGVSGQRCQGAVSRTSPGMGTPGQRGITLVWSTWAVLLEDSSLEECNLCFRGLDAHVLSSKKHPDCPIKGLRGEIVSVGNMRHLP